MKKTENIRPPRLAERLLEWYCGRVPVEDIRGDAEELFYKDLKTGSSFRAKLNYWRQVRSLVFSDAIRIRKIKSAFHPHYYTTNESAMIKSYFKLAWRTVIKNKIYSTINVVGLALGVCACLVIYTVATHELSFDKFHADGDRIYRIAMEQGKGEEKHPCACVPAPASEAIREEISAGIETVAAYHIYRPKVSIPDGDRAPKKFDRNAGAIIIAEPSYFDIFKYEWLAGTPQAIQEPFRVVLSERQAYIYFGVHPWNDILGKEVVYDDSIRASVVGIVKDWTRNTDYPFTDFISFSTIKSSSLKNDIHLDNWYDWRHSSQAFIKLKNGTSPLAVEKQLGILFRKYDHDQRDTTDLRVMAQPLSSLHINGDFDHHENLLSSLIALTTLAIFIMVIAIINFVNLSIAQSIRRAKEIGVRKVLGSFKRSLVLQFLVETSVLAFFAVSLAAFFINPLLSWFASYLPSPVRFDFGFASIFFLFFITAATSLLAGFYPARVMASYSPAVSLKGSGTHKGNEKWILRKGLIVFQFASSLFFIIATIVIGSQIDFIRNSDRGFSSESVISFRTNWGDKTSKLRILAEKVRHISGVEQVTVQSVAPMGFMKMVSNFVYEGKTKIELPVSMKAGDSEFIKLYGLRLLAGRSIADSDTLRELVINEYYSKALGFKTPQAAIGERLMTEGKSVPIVGVVGDFHEQSYREAIGPIAFGHFVQFEHSLGVKLSSSTIEDNRKNEVLARIGDEYKKLYPDEPFDPHSVNDDIESMHEREQRTATLMETAMIITIFISCLGVFGLAMFTAHLKTKEIGIRKVLGATLFNIVTMLCGDFMVLILIAIGIASPVAWYYMKDWLSGFAYRIDLTVWVFVWAGLIALLLGLLTVSFHAIKAGMTDPVESLHTE